jgi:spermidine synthase
MLFTILLLEGFITISVEILTIRQLLPFFGGSVVITSIIIGIFLLFLAVGYWRGGSYQNNFYKQLSRNFIYSLLWVGIGLSYTFIALYVYLSAYVIHMPLLVSLTCYLLIILAPIVYWLGQTIPLTTNLFNQHYRVSRISGRALFLSTIGSFLGALLTSLLLFQYLGVAITVVINCLLLLGLIFYMRRVSELSLWHAFLLSLTFAFITFLNVHPENIQFKRTNNYANYQVVSTPALGKILQINQSKSSLLTADKKGFPYIEFVRNILFERLNLRYKDILVIGAGGFSLTAAGAHDNQFTYVDIDPKIKELAEEHFLKQPVDGNFIGQDARSYLNQTDKKFDVIISDAYSHEAAVPASLLTAEYFQAISDHLNLNGLMIANIIADPFFRDDYARIVFNTIHAVFPYCAVVPLSWENPFANVMYICPKQTLQQAIYRDDLNTATLDFFKSRNRL